MQVSPDIKQSIGRIDVLFSDIDDTITTDGKITSAAFDALWKAHDAGLHVVPVTGRPAGWCDHIARMWPVHGVIGENGGLYFRMTGEGMERVYVQDSETRTRNRRKLGDLCETILASVPGTAVASDQPYREYDLAIDFCEDVEALPISEAQRVVRLFEAAGATARISSIHVNGWFGDFNKRSMVTQYVETQFGLPFTEFRDRCAFVGDSPNDEPLFEAFKWSFGVRNIERFLPIMHHLPRFITDGKGGTGFSEVVILLLSARCDHGLQRGTVRRAGRG